MFSRALVRVLWARPPHGARARTRYRGRGKDVSVETLLAGGDVIKCRAFDENVGGGIAFKGVARVVGPVVVGSVEDGSFVDFGRAAGCVVNVVSFEGDKVVFAREVEAPVVLSVAAGGVGRFAVEFAVGDGNSLVGLVACYDHHAADEVDLEGRGANGLV